MCVSVSNIQSQGMKMSRSFTGKQKTVKHKYCGSGDILLLSLPRFGGVFCLPETLQQHLLGENGNDI